MRGNRFSGITTEEISTARHCLQFALDNGASQARVAVSKNVTDSIQLLNGEIDKGRQNTLHIPVCGRQIRHILHQQVHCQ